MNKGLNILAMGSKTLKANLKENPNHFNPLRTKQ